MNVLAHAHWTNVYTIQIIEIAKVGSALVWCSSAEESGQARSAHPAQPGPKPAWPPSQASQPSPVQLKPIKA